MSDLVAERTGDPRPLKGDPPCRGVCREGACHFAATQWLPSCPGSKCRLRPLQGRRAAEGRTFRPSVQRSANSTKRFVWSDSSQKAASTQGCKSLRQGGKETSAPTARIWPWDAASFSGSPSRNLARTRALNYNASGWIFLPGPARCARRSGGRGGSPTARAGHRIALEPRGWEQRLNTSYLGLAQPGG